MYVVELHSFNFNWCAAAFRLHIISVSIGAGQARRGGDERHIYTYTPPPIPLRSTARLLFVAALLLILDTIHLDILAFFDPIVVVVVVVASISSSCPLGEYLHDHHHQHDHKSTRALARSLHSSSSSYYSIHNMAPAPALSPEMAAATKLREVDARLQTLTSRIQEIEVDRRGYVYVCVCVCVCVWMKG